MFVGHYGIALAGKRLAPKASLGALFLSVQLLDVLCAGFLLAGVEKMNITPGFTRTNPYELVFMPYSHSLAGSVAWGALAALVYGLVSRKGAPKERVAAALAIAVCVVSHYALDFPMHTPDLPLGFDADSPKIGLGLWNQPDITIAVEVGTLLAGAAFYLLGTHGRDGKDAPFVLFTAFLAVVGVATPFLPDPASVGAWAAQALIAYAAIAFVAEWLDRERVPV